MPRRRNDSEPATHSLIDASAWRKRARLAEEKLELFQQGIMLSLSGISTLLECGDYRVTTRKAMSILGVSRSSLLNYEAKGLLTPQRGPNNRRLYQLRQLLDLFEGVEHAQ